MVYYNESVDSDEVVVTVISSNPIYFNAHCTVATVWTGRFNGRDKTGFGLGRRILIADRAVSESSGRHVSLFAKQNNVVTGGSAAVRQFGRSDLPQGRASVKYTS